MTTLPSRPLLTSLATLALSLLPVSNIQAQELTLAVANSTCKAMKRVGHLYVQQHDDIRLNYICKSSGRLAKGLNGNAIEADIYLSASRQWMDYMIDAELVAPAHVSHLWGNELVVATPLRSNISNFKWDDLKSNKVESILIGDPSTAPFGRHAKQAMKSTNLWKEVRHKIQTKKHMTLLAETLAEASPATVGLLFLSNVDQSVRVLDRIDAGLHDPIRYYLAPLVKEHQKENVTSLISFIQSDSGQAVFLDEGFKLATP
jgi:molybdate transport system substrate-binding protein